MPAIVEPTSPDVAALPEALAPLREEILANLVLLGQIPAPTGGEQERVRFILDRFAEAGLAGAGEDEIGNAVGIIPGSDRNRTIAVVAHLDTVVPATVDHNITVSSEHITGPGVSDNALGASIVSMLPVCLEHLGIRLESNLKLLGTVQSLDRGNHAGLRFHLDHSPQRITSGLCLEGMQLGRLNYFSIGTLRGDITCDVRPIPTRSFGIEGAIVVLNQIINRILQIELPQRPYTRISIGKVRAGVSYDVEPDHAELGFEVNSHDDGVIDRIESRLEEICAELAARSNVDARLDTFFRRRAGGVAFSHPIVKRVLGVMNALEIEPDQGHSPSELSEFISRGTPAVTLGITHGEKHRRKPDHVIIEPILRGVAQVIGVLQEMDRGFEEPEQPEPSS